MAVEFLNELESKIDTLLLSVKTFKEENAKLSEEIAGVKQIISELETANGSMKEELESLRKNSEEKQNKLDSAAEKIQGLLSKIESAS